jgi:hypothetical protein
LCVWMDSEHTRCRELRARALEGHGAVPIIARIRRATEEEEARRAVVAMEAVGEGSVMVRPPGSAEKVRWRCGGRQPQVPAWRG